MSISTNFNKTQLHRQVHFLILIEIKNISKNRQVLYSLSKKAESAQTKIL